MIKHVTHNRNGSSGNGGRKLAHLIGDTHGGVSILTAVSISVMIAVAAFTIDMGYGYVTRAKLQATADSSALAGLIELGGDDNTTLSDAEQAAIVAAAQQYSGLNMAAGHHGTVLAAEDVFIGHWDEEGVYGPERVFYDYDDKAADAVVNAVQSRTRRANANGNPLILFFGGILGKDDVGVSARAIAAYAINSIGDSCVFAIKAQENFGINLKGAAQVDLDCGVVSNSPFDQSGSSCMWTPYIYSGESIDGSCLYEPDSLIDAPQEIGNYQDDPFCRSDDLCLGEPDANRGECSGGTTNVHVKPGEVAHLTGNTVYCGDIQIEGTAFLEPGLFHIIGGKFKVNSGAVVQTVDTEGNVITPALIPDGYGYDYGQTIFLDSSHKNDIIEINGGSNSTLLAPNSAAVFSAGGNIVNDPELEAGMAGILFYQSDEASPEATHKFNGGATMFLDGAIYTPTAECQFNGGGTVDIGKLMMVCGQIDFTGTSYFYDSPINSALDDNPYLQDFAYVKLVD